MEKYIINESRIAAGKRSAAARGRENLSAAGKKGAMSRTHESRVEGGKKAAQTRGHESLSAAGRKGGKARQIRRLLNKQPELAPAFD